VINMHNQLMNSSILKNLCQVKQETLMNKKKLNILVQHLLLDLDQVQPLSIEYLWKQLDHKKFFKNKSIEDIK
jgi:hypothetical protein